MAFHLSSQGVETGSDEHVTIVEHPPLEFYPPKLEKLADRPSYHVPCTLIYTLIFTRLSPSSPIYNIPISAFLVFGHAMKTSWSGIEPNPT